MLAEQQAKDNTAPAPAPLQAVASAPAEAEAQSDEAWARENLRFGADGPVLDSANALRVFERHELYAGRFKYNDTLNKVMDKGAVMLDWRVMEVVAEVQERFLPAISPQAVESALIVYANRAIQKKR